VLLMYETILNYNLVSHSGGIAYLRFCGREWFLREKNNHRTKSERKEE